MKVYIITLMNNRNSVAMAELAQISAIYKKRYEPILFQALDGITGAKLFATHNIKLRSGYPIHSPGHVGCIASHAALWHKCVQLDEPIIVAEHDALFLRDWDSPEYVDVLHLNCYGSYLRTNHWPEAAAKDRYCTIRENSVYRMGFEPFDFPGSVSMSTTFGYAVKPHAARILLRSLFADGYCFADRFMAEPIISIETVHPPIAHEQLTSTMSTTRE